MKRRDFLKGLTAAGVACKQPATTDLGDPLPPGIDHVVFVMMENRSFDHYFGSLSLEEGRAVEGLTPGLQNSSVHGLHHPFPLDQGSAWCPEDPPHGWSSVHTQVNAGAMDGFCSEYHRRFGDVVDPGLVMGYARRDTLPVLYQLADAYTLCDRWFCAVQGPTWPNRLFGHGGQSQGMQGNDLPTGGFFSMRTIWDQLDDAGLSWGYFYSDLPFIGLFDRAGDWVDQGKVDRIDAFYQACENGTLPAVSWVDPAFAFNDDHPPHHPLLGQMFLATIHNALAASPQWSRTLLVLTYDEHGGFYDHLAPPSTDDDLEAFRQLGVRVPGLIMGPWAKRGFVDSTVYSHSSWLAQVQALHGLEALTARNAAANDLSNAIELAGDPGAPADLTPVGFTEEEVVAFCNADRAANQPELEALVEQHWPQLDLRDTDVARNQIDWAEHFGACVVD